MRGVLVALLGFFAVSCGGGGEPVVVEGHAMGTTWRVTVAATDSPSPDSGELRRDVSALIEELEDKFSHWRAHSEVSRLNAGETAVSEETRGLIAKAEKIGAESGGAFDIRVGEQVAARGFGPAPSGEGNGMIDLSGIAKGYAVDRVTQLLVDAGYENCLVEIGGELRGRGVNRHGEPWTVGVEAPVPGARTIHLLVTLRDEAIASSGNYRLYRETEEGGIVSHFVDPRNRGRDEKNFRSVSVIADEAAVADAWATALFVLGEEEGMKLAVERQMAVCFLRRNDDGKIAIRVTPLLEKRVKR